jgi:hypothetical protein
MADNIQIVGSILNIQEISRYDGDDIKLLSSQKIKEDFGQPNDYIEYFVYDAGGNLLNTNYSYKSFKSPSTSYVDPANGYLPIIEIDPVKDLQNLGYTSGEFKVYYNFLDNKISNPDAGLFLKEISADRTELRIGSTVLNNQEIEEATNALISEYTSSAYFVEYLVNFGDNKQAVVVNTALNKVESGYEILFKLYQPLPDDIQEKATLWVVSEKINPYVFDINLDKLITLAPGPKLRGPNFNIEINNQNNVATSYQNYTSLINDIQSISTSSYQQLLSLITSQSIDINVDYTDFNNFVFFSSAEQRVLNFYKKVQKIEGYNSDISVYIPLTASRVDLIKNYNAATASINDIISKFDGFEYYLYFESSSAVPGTYGINPYPKSTATLPFTLYPTSSLSAQSWLIASTSSAAYYDDNNQNYVINTLPLFIKDDEDNEPYITFIDMIGHYFDNIWIFLQAITDVNLANNNLEKGVSKDLVYDVLQSLGIKLYNQYGDSGNVNFLIGQSGSANFDNNFTITGSYLNTIPRKNLLAESYKRIYHNLPLLLKTKGTTYGLQTLVSTFGITGSTLVVKEYGGDLKSNTLDEFNNDKIRIVSNSITGSVLSPYVSLQLQPTASTSFRTNDLNYVDISFSPQDKIDIFTSASIASSNPTWNMDDFIGDPRFQYSGSYPTLEIERNTYLSPLSASLVPFTGSAGSGSIGATNYNDFIRLIQFFDNSLFKMLKDYVPARTSLSTGVTISSPILERNKWVYANPSSTSKIKVEDGTIEGPTIGTEYTDIYDGLTGSRAAYYDGAFTGSVLDTYQYFVSGNSNPYLFLSSSLTANDINVFNHTEFNIMLNNVSESLISNNRQDIEYIFGTTQQITSSAELQDSYNTLLTHQLSRYDGVKISSLEYNNYNEGDTSFGKTAVIDKNVVKLGLFTEIATSRFLPRRNNAIVKYLVDIEGNLTELNLRNKHWEEVQNTFVAGDTGSISQFNNQLYSNQKITDGEKPIFDSGYAYTPILYFGITGSDSTIAFQSIGEQTAYLATALNNLSPNGFISGSGTNAYPLSGGYVYNIFDKVVEGASYFRTGSTTYFPSYSVQETGNHLIQASIPFTYEVSTLPVNNATWSLQVYKSGSTGETLLAVDRQYFVAGDPATSTLTFSSYNGGVFYFTLSDPIPSTNISIRFAGVTGYTLDNCNFTNEQDDLTSNILTIAAGDYSGNANGNSAMGCSNNNYRRGNTFSVNGELVYNGSVITIGGTQVTISIPPTCEYYAC